MGVATTIPAGRQRDAERDFNALFESHYDAVLAYAIRRTDRTTAEDVAAETFAIAWRRLRSVPREARPWLLGVARKVLANTRRSAARRQALVVRLARQPQSEELATSELSDLGAALSRLGEKDREALLLAAWEGLPPREAATVMGVTPTVYRVRLYRARRRLKAELEGGVDAPAPRERAVTEAKEHAR